MDVPTYPKDDTVEGFGLGFFDRQVESMHNPPGNQKHQGAPII